MTDAGRKTGREEAKFHSLMYESIYTVEWFTIILPEFS
jgi:hypothetical protein